MSTDLEGKPQWIQKDRKGGYKELLCLCTKNCTKNQGYMFDLLIPAAEVSKITAESYTNIDSFLAYLEQLLQNYKVSVFLTTYSNNDQFADIYNFVAIARHPPNIDRVSKLVFQKKCTQYFIYKGILFVSIRSMQKRYILQKEVSKVLRVAYNLKGYQQLCLTIKKLQLYYQPRIVKDAADYIIGCIQCAKHRIV